MAVFPNVDTPENKLFQHLSKCPYDRLNQLLHHLIDVFCGQKHSYAYYSDVYSLLDWWELIGASADYFKEIYSENTQLSLNSGSECEKILTDVIEVRSGDLKACLLEKSHQVSPSYLKSFDWKLKLVLASDKMAQINEPRLLLSMDVTGNKVLHLDLNKNELKSLIDTLEKAKQAVADMTED